jgi:RNase H-fold protein (predicted Holliday junction resolvase)
VFTNVAPKRLAVEQAERDLAAANEKKATMEAKVADLMAALQILQDQFQAVMDDKN